MAKGEEGQTIQWQKEKKDKIQLLITRRLVSSNFSKTILVMADFPCSTKNIDVFQYHYSPYNLQDICIVCFSSIYGF
jgi:hypothetical protein